jgi:5-histidylcysteine sulfoxide synthase/putative 4-mercaptohistidine N1-methyltranferase
MEIIPNISLNGTTVEAKREEIKAYFNNTYDVYESLFETLVNDQAFYAEANALRHPIIFYFGHTATFFINKLIIDKTINERVNPKFESMFAVGVDEMSWDDLNKQHYKWASVEEVKAYRDDVRVLVNNLIDTLPLTLPIDWKSPFWAILMGCEHERIHIETSSVLIRQLDLTYIKPTEGWEVCYDSGSAPKNELLEVRGRTIIRNRDNNYYGWDNEYGFHQATIPSFKASKFLVTNQEFLDFVHDNGYKNDIYWEEEGVEWRNFVKANHPSFWYKKEDGYQLRMMLEVVDLPLNHPAEVNYHEAKAYCNWLSQKEGKKLRLPTEDEWYCLVENVELTESSDANINLKYYASTMPVDSFEHKGFYDVRGNVWQWSETTMYPFDGFKVHPIYDDFTVPTFDNEHHLIKGGSWISTGNEALLSARFAFRKHFFQHAGFRYVQSSYQEQIKTNSYESDDLVNQYIEFGWGSSHLGVENYAVACAKIAIEAMGNRAKSRALDVGCAIGRSSFELARAFDEVTGIDYTARFIQSATQMKEQGSLNFTTPTEGELFEYKQVTLENLNLTKEASKVTFWQGDACNLKSLYQGYDLIFAGNLIDRLYNPKKFLKSMAERLNPNGLLILSSPYTWLEEYTPKEQWIGGYRKDGENFSTLDGLHKILDQEFKLISTKDIPFVIAETARKHQYTIAQMSIWEKQ